MMLLSTLQRKPISRYPYNFIFAVHRKIQIVIISGTHRLGIGKTTNECAKDTQELQVNEFVGKTEKNGWDEELKETHFENLMKLLELREKLLIERTAYLLGLFEVEKQKLESRGYSAKIPKVKQKQEKLLLKMQEERKYLKRLLAMNRIRQPLISEKMLKKLTKQSIKIAKQHISITHNFATKLANQKGSSHIGCRSKGVDYGDLNVVTLPATSHKNNCSSSEQITSCCQTSEVSELQELVRNQSFNNIARIYFQGKENLFHFDGRFATVDIKGLLSSKFYWKDFGEILQTLNIPFLLPIESLTDFKYLPNQEAYRKDQLLSSPIMEEALPKGNEEPMKFRSLRHSSKKALSTNDIHILGSVISANYQLFHNILTLDNLSSYDKLLMDLTDELIRENQGISQEHAESLVRLITPHDILNVFRCVQEYRKEHVGQSISFQDNTQNYTASIENLLISEKLDSCDIWQSHNIKEVEVLHQLLTELIIQHVSEIIDDILKEEDIRRPCKMIADPIHAP